MTNNTDRAADIIDAWTREGNELNSHVGSPHAIARRLADAGLLMPDIPDGLNLIGFERKGGGGGLLWDDRITTEALTKGYAAMFARLAEREASHAQDD